MYDTEIAASTINKRVPLPATEAALALAVAAGHPVSFNYDGKLRIVEVHAVGLNSKGEPVFRGYQTGGEASRPLPTWTLFSLNKVSGLSLGLTPSRAPREGYAMNDKQIATMLAQIVI